MKNNTKETKKDDFQLVKEITPIRDLLRRRYGMHPNRNGMIQAFWRGERCPSVHVDAEKNVWHDFGTGKGGSVIDLVMVAENVTARQALEILLHDYGRVKTTRAYLDPDITTEERKGIIVDSIDANITDRRLVSYMASRGISAETLEAHCCQVNYINLKNPNKVLTAIGMANDRGGYDIRNPWFKGCVVAKGLTFIAGTDHSTVAVFEGMTDALSYLQTTHYHHTAPDIIVLHGVGQSHRAVKHILEKDYERVWLFLDWDASGRRKTEEMSRMLKDLQVFDMMEHVRNTYPKLTRGKDYNEIYCLWLADNSPVKA